MPNHTQVLSVVSLVVDDVHRSVDFYRLMGLDVPEESIYSEGDTGHHVSVHMGNGLTLDIDSLELTRRWAPNWEPPAGGAQHILSFALPSPEAVDAKHDEIVAAGHASQVAPFDAFWGARYAVVVDPDGNPVGLSHSSD